MAFRSIASRLALWVLAGSTLVLVISGLLFFDRAREQILQHTHREAFALTGAAANRISSRIGRVSNTTQLLAGLMVTRGDDAASLLRDALSANNDLAGLSADFVPDADGKVSMPAPFVSRQPDGRINQRDLRGDATAYWQQPWFTRGLACSTGCWQQVFLSQSRHRRLISYAVAIRRGQTTAGIVNADVTLDWLQGVLQAASKPDGAYAFVIDDRGEYLAHDRSALIGTHADAALLGASAAAEPLRLAGGTFAGRKEPVWVYRAPIENTQWSFGLVVPESRIFSEVRWLFLINSVLGVLALLCIALIVMVVTRRMLAPLQSLAGGAEHVARGELDFPLPAVKRHDEVGRLTLSFDLMRKELAMHLQNLANAARQQQRLSSELEIAHQIQTALLPSEHYLDARCSQFELHAALRPARTVSGDLYSYFMLDAEHFCVMVGDVSDKGIPAALFMARTITLAKALAVSAREPSELLKKLNRELCRSNDSCMFVSLLCGVLETNRGCMVMASAGHEPPILCGRGAPQLIEVETGAALGLDEDASYPTFQLDLVPGDTLLMYTDGVTEATDVEMQMFGIERTLQSLARVPDLSDAADYTTQLLTDMEQFVADAPQADDITVLALDWGRGDDETVPAALEATIDNKMDQAFALMARCDELLEKNQVAESQRHNIQLALEELLVNMVQHGQPSGRAGHIDLQLRVAASTVVIELHNNGIAFDPLQAAAPELTGDIADQQQVGGLGIHLVRSLTSHIRYNHDKRGNHLLLRFSRFDPTDPESSP